MKEQKIVQYKYLKIVHSNNGPMQKYRAASGSPLCLQPVVRKPSHYSDILDI